MPQSLCRLTIQCAEIGGVGIDLALPGDACVGDLMPSIIEVVHGDRGGCVVDSGHRLSRIGGFLLDESRSLRDNDIHDGDLLMLTATEPDPPQWVTLDSAEFVAQAAEAGPTSRKLPVVCALFMAGIGATAIVWSAASAGSAAHTVTACGLSAAAAISAVVARRTQPAALMCPALGITAVLFAALAGFLAVPGEPGAPHALLTSAATLATAILVLRVTRCGTELFTAVISTAGLFAGIAAIGVAWRLSLPAAGASLAVLSLAILGAAPRLSMAVAGIRPLPPDVDDIETCPPPLTRTQLAHQTLTGLVAGISLATALGAVLVAAGHFRHADSLLSAASFAAVVGSALLLRTRTHAQPVRGAVLAVSGLVSIATGFAVVVRSLPAHGWWVGVVATAAGAVALSQLIGLTVSPSMRRAAEVTEYIALALVVPVACWAGGLYHVVRGLGLL
jgi:type VII secretion integral membrane protein EccD